MMTDEHKRAWLFVFIRYLYHLQVKITMELLIETLQQVDM